ncbi:small conductance mechanosensitive channel [Pedococcus dokdonensis]|uniref:Small conductance mechanosensitive channel n=1 Tax=Pedococcus dokdonensis TaxID=443156 RepID=A0A1H0QHR7_9MICO|nr:mechanosensitive ion channel family protein [Pedococcus dokdonensis]SDP16218.1 small conductance mechanosensitive channel [Pedococcus dokdonensis]
MPEAVTQVLTALSEVTPKSAWEWFTGAPSSIVITIVGALILRWLALRSIGRVVRVTLARSDARRSREPASRAGRVLAQATGAAHERHRQRTLTMGSLLRSSVTFIVALVTILTVMGIVGINLAPVLATAGVGGVALGFGAQSLVKDFLSGIFMILEDQYGVGDVIDTGEAIGTVEEVSLRVTRLRDGQGVVWYIRNGEIIRIGNKSQGWSTAMVDIPVAYSENLEKVIPLIRTVVHELDESPDWAEKLLEEPQVMGVESMTGSVVTIRVIAKTAPEQQYGVSREIRERVKATFDEHGVTAPVMTPFGPAAGAR